MAYEVLQHPHGPPESVADRLHAGAHNARLVAWRIGLAASVAFSALYLACALAVALFPQATLDLFNAWFHGLDLNLLRPAGGRPLTVQQFVVGWLAVIGVAFPVGAILAWTYNASSPTYGDGTRNASAATWQDAAAAAAPPGLPNRGPGA